MPVPFHNQFGTYQKGRRTYAGGQAIGRLVRAVIHFLNRWRLGKEKFERLAGEQRQWSERLDADDQPRPALNSAPTENGHGPDR